MIIQFGHVCENPHEWEQRFEKRDFNQNLYQGKVYDKIYKINRLKFKFLIFIIKIVYVFFLIDEMG